MGKQLYDTGDVIQAGVNALEVTGVSYQENDGEKVNFSYTVRLQSEVEAERAEQKQAEKAAQVAEKENAKLTPVSAGEEPLDPPTEE